MCCPLCMLLSISTAARIRESYVGHYNFFFVMNVYHLKLLYSIDSQINICCPFPATVLFIKKSLLIKLLYFMLLLLTNKLS